MRAVQGAWGLAAVLALAGAMLSGGHDVAPGRALGGAPDQVVADLSGGRALSGALRDALRAQRAAPHDPAPALAAARRMIDEGRANGDSRLVGAALAVLQPLTGQGGLPAAQYLAALARQYQHDFPGALALLDAVLAADPRDVNALLNRATIHTVRGDFPAALRDCARIAGLRAEVGFLCQATSLTLTRDAPQVAARLDAILAKPGAMDAGLMPWARSLRGEIALLQGDTATAGRHLAQVLADDPGAQREQLMLADLLLAQGRPAEADRLLRTAPDTDGVLIRRVLAARAEGRDAQAVVDVLAARAQRSLDIGLAAHAREEAMFFLRVTPDPARALERATANWALQHEVDDARLLLLAADAAGTPAAALPVLAWLRAADLHIPALEIPPSVAGLAP